MAPEPQKWTQGQLRALYNRHLPEFREIKNSHPHDVVDVAIRLEQETQRPLSVAVLVEKESTLTEKDLHTNCIGGLPVRVEKLPPLKV